MECYSAIKMSGLPIQTATWMHLKIILLAGRLDKKAYMVYNFIYIQF